MYTFSCPTSILLRIVFLFKVHQQFVLWPTFGNEHACKQANGKMHEKLKRIHRTANIINRVLFFFFLFILLPMWLLVPRRHRIVPNIVEKLIKWNTQKIQLNKYNRIGNTGATDYFTPLYDSSGKYHGLNASRKEISSALASNSQFSTKNAICIKRDHDV